VFEAGRAVPGVARDAHVLGAVRPENVLLAAREPAARNRLIARVAARVMLGDAIEFVLALPDGREMLSRMSRRGVDVLPEGGEVWAYWEPHSFTLFPFEDLEARKLK
jgi:TOBE domain